jgi:hypothetical protein
MYIYNFLLRMTDTMTSQDIDLSSWDSLYILRTSLPHPVSSLSVDRRTLQTSNPFLSDNFVNPQFNGPLRCAVVK